LRFRSIFGAHDQGRCVISISLKTAVAGLVAALALVAAAVPAYSSLRLARDLQELAAQPGQDGLVLRDLVHEAGYLSSQGSVYVQWRSPCEAQPQDRPNRVKLVYQVSHLPGWDAAGHFSWTATPEGEAGAALAQLMAAGGHLSGQGELSYGGLLQTRMALPALDFAAAGASLHIAPSRGTLAVGKNTLQLDWTLDHWVQQGPADALAAKQLQFSVRLDDGARGGGSFSLSAHQLDTRLLALQDVQLRSETRVSAERLQATVSASAQSARFLGQTLTGLQLALSASDLHAPSLQQLLGLYAQSCGLRTLTAPASQQFRAALNGLLAAGFSLGVSSLQGRSGQGSLDGSMVLQLEPAGAEPVALARQLQSSGQLRIRGNLLAPEQQQAALDQGWLQQTSDGLLARYAYTQGALQLGATRQDSSLLQGVLARMDEALAAFVQANGVWTPRVAVSDDFSGPNAPAVAAEPAPGAPPK
jgi:hypothetical protein